ncbi:hypothetical protein D3C75_607310 [compost metagenome]
MLQATGALFTFPGKSHDNVVPEMVVRGKRYTIEVFGFGGGASITQAHPAPNANAGTDMDPAAVPVLTTPDHLVRRSVISWITIPVVGSLTLSPTAIKIVLLVQQPLLQLLCL